MRSVLLSILLVSGLLSPAYSQQLKEINNSIGMKMVLILPGTFKMGSAKEEVDRMNNETQHLVSLSNWFYLGIYEVTQEQYERVMGANPSHFKGEMLPVESITWDEAVSFCNKLSEMCDEKAAARSYRLPTEAEWEYACRAGSGTAYAFGDRQEDIFAFARYGGEKGTTYQVGKTAANKWGVFDMHGNVFEWCQDRYGDLSANEVTDPQGPLVGTDRVFRGGSWNTNPGYSRSARRGGQRPLGSDNCIGFRVATTPPSKQSDSVIKRK
jgi:formylglycine-generating enzyme required for sulfatase activity